MSLGLGGGAGKPYVIKKNQPVESLERDKMIDKENPSNEKTDGKKVRKIRPAAV